ncbi:hypothetical protein M2333_000232 [Sphingobium sp. B11D3B]|uniref:hypothetical protein n=1 Tax=Sphingobium sp. B11D3B TaxID=2940575 RepID=UPI002227A6C4|nr:hypothetical protein [Sphingobium sp. B11D3B]MCW2387186.1 hypothetical protein [Sphingobium sp. B11D3B]
MMKKIVLAALSGAALIAGAGSANAATATATSGLTFTVGAACTLTAGAVDLGSYVVGDTVQTYADRQGSINTANVITAGSEAAKTLASVTCPSGTAWSLRIAGAGSVGDFTVNDPSNNAVFSVLPYKRTVGGVAQAGYMSAAGQGATGTGTGAAQIVAGNFITRNATSAQLATALVTGTYTGAATATLTY